MDVNMMPIDLTRGDAFGDSARREAYNDSDDEDGRGGEGVQCKAS